ncbi:MAG: SAP domain-containing protein [Treponemataceae bacterium]|nr:SAP domain-containing protein [Treponemataceae bacterium]
MERRPRFDEIKSFQEFSRYYWYRDELQKICRRLGLDALGMKAELNHVIEEYFKGNRVKEKRRRQPLPAKAVEGPLTLQSGLLECGFCFSQRFRAFFSTQTGIRNFKFNVDMVATVRKVKENGDTSFALGDLLEVFYGERTYAKYDKSSLQWNQFVKDFCADPATASFPDKLKAAAALWKEVRQSTRKKVYRHELLEEFKASL